MSEFDRNTEVERREGARRAALAAAIDGRRRLARPEDYVFDKAQEAFWDLADNTLHTEKGVDASIPQELWRVEVTEAPEPAPDAPPRRGRPPLRKERLIPPSRDISRVENDQFVEGSTWWPGREQIIKDWFIDASGFHPAAGRRSYNQYKAPPTAPTEARAEDAGRWLAHVRRVWPEPREHEFFFDVCAHMVQRPAEKCNAAIVLSGAQRIGKDAALAPIRAAVGAWNVKSIDPDEIFSAFRPWLQTLMLVVNEVRPSKDEFHASSLYNILKPMIAAPPDTLPLNDKNAKLRYVINVMRVFLTTNDWMAMYIPPGDQRMFIMHSPLESEWHVRAGEPDYFSGLFGWMESGGGNAAVAAWLAARDLSAFNPKGIVPKTAGWESVAGTWEEGEDGVGFALAALGGPDVLFATELVDPQFDFQEDVMGMLKSPRKIGHRMAKAGYALVKCPTPSARGGWEFQHDGRRFRTRMAFVKTGAALSGGAVINALNARGKAIVGRK